MLRDKEKALNELQLKLLELLINIENETITYEYVVEVDDYEVTLKFTKKTKRFLTLVDSD